MAGLYGLGRAFYAYTSDDTNVYEVALTNDDAAAGGFGSAVPQGTNPVYPRGWRMRKCYGVTDAGVRTKTPLNANTNTNYTAGGTFTKKDTEFTVEGIIGEKRTARA
jgi:hypothetical protein